MKLFEDYPFAQSELSVFHSMKKDGNMSTRYCDIPSVFERRSKFFHQNISDNSCIIHIRANHKTVIRPIPDDIAEEIIECDGVISHNPRMYFSIAFGDCFPLVLYDLKNIHLAMHAVAIRVSINDFIPLITQSLIQEYGSHPSDLEILIGPCIKAHSLELDDISALNREAWKNHVMIHNNGNHSVDLISRVVTDLSLLGIKYNNIYRSIRDTGNDDELFSHYRSTHLGEEEGRFLFCVGLKN